MRIEEHNSPVPFLIIEDLFESNELSEVMLELDCIRSLNLLMSPKKIGGATDESGNLLKSNSGVWLDSFYANAGREKSRVLTHTRRLFNDPEIAAAIKGHRSWFFKDGFFSTNTDNTLLTYYENGGYYGAHKDNALFTAIIWLFKEPRAFKGGEFWFSDYDLHVPVENNKAIIFPSVLSHMVTKVEITGEHSEAGCGRYALSVFIRAEDKTN